MKTAFVTGASSGIGRATAVALAEAGFRAGDDRPAGASASTKLAASWSRCPRPHASPSTCATGRQWKRPWPSCQQRLQAHRRARQQRGRRARRWSPIQDGDPADWDADARRQRDGPA
ncbi:MAG: hypothetical protein WKG07_33530 [Hymenobacter sp.]